MSAGEAGGQPGNPGKTSQEELRARVEFTLFLVNRRLAKSAIKGQLAKRYGVSGRTAERYLRVARKLIEEATGKPRSQHRLEALWFFESIVTGPDASVRERLDAQREIASLLGLYPPRRVRMGGDPKSPPIKTERADEVKELLVLAAEEARQVEELMRRAEERADPREPKVPALLESRGN